MKQPIPAAVRGRAHKKQLTIEEYYKAVPLRKDLRPVWVATVVPRPRRTSGSFPRVSPKVLRRWTEWISSAASPAAIRRCTVRPPSRHRVAASRTVRRTPGVVDAGSGAVLRGATAAVVASPASTHHAGRSLPCSRPPAMVSLRSGACKAPGGAPGAPGAAKRFCHFPPLSPAVRRRFMSRKAAQVAILRAHPARRARPTPGG